jgi:Tfp pilus assembly protein PilX
MNEIKAILKDERRVVLVIAFMVLSLLVGVGVGAIVSIQTDLKTSANIKAGTQAFYLATAGIERGKQKVKDSAANPPNPSVETQSLSWGSFTVSFSDNVKISNLEAKVKISSTGTLTGTLGTASNSVEALVTKTYELSDAAVSIRGTEANSKFTGNSFLVDGRDYDPATGTLVAGAKEQFGISVSSSTLEGQVEGALSNPQEGNVLGKDGSTPNVEQNGLPTTEEVEQLANDLCSAAGAIVDNVATGDTLSITGTNTYGTTAAPEIRCFTGQGSGEAVNIGGTFTGVGVLVVRDAELNASGAFHWEGLVLVSGTNVGFSVSGSGNKDIFGSVMINERGTDSGDELDLQGAVKVRYSSSALKTAAEVIPLSALEAIFDSLSSTITQNYWATVTN